MAADADPDEFKHTHYYDPVGWDQFDPKPHPGSGVIAPGSPVQNMGRMGPGKGGGKLAFHHIRDQAGNNQSVWRASIKTKNAYQKKVSAEAEAQSAPPGERLGYGASHKHHEEQAEAIHEQYFHDRRGEGRRDRPI